MKSYKGSQEFQLGAHLINERRDINKKSTNNLCTVQVAKQFMDTNTKSNKKKHNIKFIKDQ